MKVILLASMLMLTSISTHAENSICDGKFANGQSVHVNVNWDKNTVNVNGTDHLIIGVNDVGDGIVTAEFDNALQAKTYFVIGHFNNGKGYIGQYSEFRKQNNGNYRVLNWAILSCSKPFTKPFMTRMLKSL